MYYVRKLSNKGNLYKLRSAENTASINADILKQELGTSNDTLSFWKCENYDNLDDTDLKNTIKAILLSTTAIKTSQFIIVEESFAKRYGLIMDDAEKGKTGYKGYEDLHVNMIDLTYEKIGNVLDMLREVTENERYTPSLDKDDVKHYISEVYEAGLLDRDAISPDLLKDINKYLST